MPIADTPVINIEDVCCSNLDNIPQVPIYRPTFDEFKDFSKFIELIEQRGAHHMGICKIIPPKGWKARKDGYKNDVLDKLLVLNPITQTTVGADGIYAQDIRSERTITFKEYRDYSNNKNMTPTHMDWTDLERKYWSNITYAKPQYGANVPGTITDEDQTIWNVARLPTILDNILRDQGLLLDGINTPYLYFGSWQTTFGWHVEDVDLYSINYLHFGMPKFWYCIPPAYARKFELLVRDLYKADFLKCESFLRHKTVVLSPSFLKKFGIPTRKIVQEENDFMYTFPYGYHSGFNMGLNIAESTNFASTRWIEYGKQAKLCFCWPDTVKINMEPFVRVYQTNQHYEEWAKGRNTTPHPLRVYETKFSELKNNNSKSYTNADNNNAIMGSRTKRKSKSEKLGDNLVQSKVIKSSEDSLLEQSKKQSNVFFDIFAPENLKKGSRIQRAHPLKSSTIKSENLDVQSVSTEEGHGNQIKQAVPDAKMDISTIGKTVPRLLRNNFQALWRGNPYDFEVERSFNELIGNFHPHCAVCSIIWPISKVSEIITNGKFSNSPMPKSTEPHIPQMAFSKEQNFVVSNQLKSFILRCSKCYLTVHARCYGKTELEKSMRKNDAVEDWLCDRCLKFSPNIYCCLCSTRGGALKKMSNSNGHNRWAHIVCTLVIKDLQFDDVVRRRPQYPVSKYSRDSSSGTTSVSSTLSQSTSNYQLQMSYQKCYICRGRQFHTPLCKCTYENCSSYIHVTCAFFHSILIESETYPDLLFLICDKHPHYYSKQQAFHSTSTVSSGDYVYAQNPEDGYFYLAALTNKVSEAYCKLIFPTGEFSDDTEIQYIKSHNIAREGPPSIGTIVTVLWTDDELIDVKFQGLVPEVWSVKFKHSNNKVDISRDLFYKTTEPIPPHVERFLILPDSKIQYTNKKNRNSLSTSTDSAAAKAV